jgi:hypothetical protein
VECLLIAKMLKYSQSYKSGFLNICVTVLQGVCLETGFRWNGCLVNISSFCVWSKRSGVTIRLLSLKNNKPWEIRATLPNFLIKETDVIGLFKKWKIRYSTKKNFNWKRHLGCICCGYATVLEINANNIDYVLLPVLLRWQTPQMSKR